MRLVRFGVLRESQEAELDVIITILKTPANQMGAGVDELRRTVPLLEKLAEIRMDQGDAIYVDAYLEEAHWEVIRDRLQSATFTQNRRDVLDMVERVMNAKEIPADQIAKAIKAANAQPQGGRETPDGELVYPPPISAMEG